jgi:hypothetical protein
VTKYWSGGRSSTHKGSKGVKSSTTSLPCQNRWHEKKPGPKSSLPTLKQGAQQSTGTGIRLQMAYPVLAAAQISTGRSTTKQGWGTTNLVDQNRSQPAQQQQPARRCCPARSPCAGNRRTRASGLGAPQSIHPKKRRRCIAERYARRFTRNKKRENMPAAATAATSSADSPGPSQHGPPLGAGQAAAK